MDPNRGVRVGLPGVCARPGVNGFFMAAARPGVVPWLNDAVHEAGIGGRFRHQTDRREGRALPLRSVRGVMRGSVALTLCFCRVALLGVDGRKDCSLLFWLVAISMQSS